MRTVTFQSVLWGAARLLGMDPTRDLNAQTAARLVEYINRAVAKGWRFDQWPEWTLTEQRFFRPEYDATEAVVATVERYFIAADKYYQALQASTGQLPATLQADGTYQENSAYWAECKSVYDSTLWATGQVLAVGDQRKNPSDGKFYQCHTAHTAGATFDATKFGLLTAFQRYVAYDQTEANGTPLTVIWEAPNPCAFRRDPRVYPNNPWPLTTSRNDLGITFASCPVNVVWLRFWTKPPEFTSTLISSTATYAAGVSIYDPATGDCWKSNQAISAGQSPTTNPEKWDKIQFPFVLSAYVKRMAQADVLRDQKQTSRADDETENAEAELQDEVDKAMTGQGIYETATAATAPSPGI